LVCFLSTPRKIKSTTPSLLGRDTPPSKVEESFDWYVFYSLRVKTNQPPHHSWVVSTPPSKVGESFDWYVFYSLRVKTNQPPRYSCVVTPLLQKEGRVLKHIIIIISSYFFPMLYNRIKFCYFINGSD
jgi:hypothetical protein